MQEEGFPMKAKGQRQDIAFLALAVAVLAIAVALFVGIRSLPGRGARPAPSQPKETAPKVAAKPVDQRPPGSATHNPFQARALPGTQPGRAARAGPGAEPRPGPRPTEEMKLVGVVQGRDPLAVIRRGERRHYVKAGDRVASYTVAEISSHQAVLTKGQERLVLPLRPPPPPEE